MTTGKKPEKIKNLCDEIKRCIELRKFTQSKHAIQRQHEREIGILDVLYVLKTGREEKNKTKFDDDFQVWKYAVRGYTVENHDIRVIISFDETGMLIITVMHVIKGKI